MEGTTPNVLIINMLFSVLVFHGNFVKIQVMINDLSKKLFKSPLLQLVDIIYYDIGVKVEDGLYINSSSALTRTS